MREPYAWVLVEFFELLDRERLEAHGERLKDLERARLAALAFHAPADLKTEKEAAMRELQAPVERAVERDRIAQLGRVIRRAERRRGH